MTREEQINKEAYRQEKLVDIDVESFIAGAKWADANPTTPWISVKEDLPCNNEFPRISVNEDLPNKKLENR